jgi:hypothetical protein
MWYPPADADIAKNYHNWYFVLSKNRAHLARGDKDIRVHVIGHRIEWKPIGIVWRA